MFNHSNWLSRLVVHAKANQKTFRVVNLASGREDVDAIDISLMQDAAVDSAASETGWLVDVRYTNAPTNLLFTQVYPTEDQARKVFDDLVLFSAEIEGLVKSEKFEEAKTKTEELMRKFKANSGQTPVSENQPSAQTPL